MSKHSTPFTIPCVIFAGGKSARMGKDKALLPFGNSPTLTHYIHQKMSKIFNRVYISSKESEKFQLDANYILDSSRLYAPTSGFVSTFEALEDEAFFVISVDTPFIDLEIIEKLYALDSKTSDATIAKTDQGTHPLCGIYHRSLHNNFKEMLKEDNHKLGKMLSVANTNYVPFENEEKFMNLNHPNEYEKALTYANRVLG